MPPQWMDVGVPMYVAVWCGVVWCVHVCVRVSAVVCYM